MATDHDASRSMTTAAYQGLLGRTRQEALHYTCESCGFIFGSAVYTSVNVASDPELGDRLSRGELNLLTCTACGARCAPGIPLVYHDPEARCFALLTPESMRHEELHLRARTLQSLADDPADIPDYVRRASVVFGTPGLMRLLDEARSPAPWEREEALAQLELALQERLAGLEQREGELVAREEDLHAKQEDLVAQRTALEWAQGELAQSWAELEREREALQALALKLRSEPVSPPADDAGTAQPGDAAPPEVAARPQQQVDTWRAGEEPTGLACHEGQTFLLARPGADLATFTSSAPEILLQLFETPGGPVIVLVALPATRTPGADAAGHALCWFLDPSTAEHQKVLERLAETFAMTMDLYDDESRRVASFAIRAPLEENARMLLDRAVVLLAQTEAIDFTRAVETYRGLDAERLGRKQHNFTADSFKELPSPAAARLALGIVTYWSEPANERYLIDVKSFPVRHWRGIRERVVRGAIEFGLHLSPELTDCALRRKLTRGRKELLRTCVANFAEVSLRIKPCDLDPGQELENWRLLLASCMKEGVPVDVEIEELAAAAAKRAGVAEDESAPGGDLGSLDDAALVSLLNDRGQRRDAALELCERGSPRMAEALFRATCNMTRAEVARVIPAMISLGAGTVRHFIAGLKHRKSFIRQGCALALGAMRANDGIGPLTEMLLSEPTNVWREAARALGDMGLAALAPLRDVAKEGDGEARERLAWALAQSALDPTCRADVEATAKDRDIRLARVAGRALELLDVVRSSDQEVRGSRPAKEQTIVRRFTRQFFEAIGGNDSELNEEDILEQEEVLDDTDILDEAVEVQEDDIL